MRHEKLKLVLGILILVAILLSEAVVLVWLVHDMR
jgi:hypothetical protein